MRGAVRIIGGKWRGRKVVVPEVPGLRPTPDRIRETLFNWLAGRLAGAHCLDAFAGSGVLGFEAVSRGAAFACLVDSAPVVIRALQKQCEIFAAGAQVAVLMTDLLSGLPAPAKPFDIVFLDPPYAAGLLLPACFLLAERKWVASGARIYLEAPAPLAETDLPPGWHLIKSQRAGEVYYHLASVEKND